MQNVVSLKEIVEIMTTGKNVQIQDFSICGKCSKCGECCSNFLPVSQTEIDTIQEYVLKNNIKPQTQMLVMQNRLSCPYYDGSKCVIYEVRPLICKEFYCNKKPDIEMAMKFAKEERVGVNMWGIAKEIEEQRKRYETNRKR